MKLRKGWLVVWADGTEWKGDCPQWAVQPLPEGARLVPIRIGGTGKYPCPGCEHGRH